MLKVGVDCERISRFKRLPYDKMENFYKRIFTPREIEYCVSCREPYHRFAARFAAKEAVIKALNGILKPYYKDIEVRKEKNGEPKIHIDKKQFRKVKALSMSLSLAHSKTHAIAFVIVTDNVKENGSFKRALKKITPLAKKNFGK
jgi:holo-[acyl-carrier protein] synthase